jgi:fimbrial protein
MNISVIHRDKKAPSALIWLALVIMLCFWTGTAQARCYRGPDHVDRGGDSNQGSMGFGTLNLMSAYLQPPGTIIASNVVSPSIAFSGAQAATAESVLYYCDTAADAAQVKLLVATNGDEPVGGKLEVPGYPGTYYTFYKYIGARITVVDTGQVVRRNWAEVPISIHYNAEKSRNEVKMGAVSDVRVDLIRIDSEIPSFSGGWGPDYQIATGAYTTNQPLFYYAFDMPNYPGPSAGADSNSDIRGWAVEWLAFGMYKNPQAYLYNNASCVIRNHTPMVVFPTVNTADVEAGQTVNAELRVDVECDNGVATGGLSGTGGGQTAFGFQVSPQAYKAAQSIPGLVTSAGGVEYLLSEGYGTDPAVAKGVGIRLRHGATGADMRFIGWQGNCGGSSPGLCGANTTGGGSAAGWFPVLDGASGGQATGNQTRLYEQHVIATLERIPGQTVTPGRIRAQVQVLVRVQ